MSATAFVWIYLIRTAYSLIVLGVCAYVVFWLGFSGWWFVLALVLLSYAGEAETTIGAATNGRKKDGSGADER